MSNLLEAVRVFKREGQSNTFRYYMICAILDNFYQKKDELLKEGSELLAISAVLCFELPTRSPDTVGAVELVSLR